MLMNVKVSLIIWKVKLPILKRKIKKNLPQGWHIIEKARRKTHGILIPKQIIMCGFKKMFVELMNQRVIKLLLDMHPKFR